MRRSGANRAASRSASGACTAVPSRSTRPITLFCTINCRALGDAGRKHAPLLHTAEVILAQHPGRERLPQDVRRRDRVLHREIDADAADGRHGVRGIADAQKARAVPAIQPVDRDREQLDLVPVL